jgi:hypothetical protein
MNLEDQVFQALTSPITSGQADKKAIIPTCITGTSMLKHVGRSPVAAAHPCAARRHRQSIFDRIGFPFWRAGSYGPGASQLNSGVGSAMLNSSISSA